MSIALKPDNEQEQTHNPSHQDYDEKFVRDFENRRVLTDEELAQRRAGHQKNDDGDPATEQSGAAAELAKRERSERSTPPEPGSKSGLGRGFGKKGGIVALIGLTGISLTAIFNLMLLPLKIPGVLQSIADEAGQRVQNVTERRAKQIVARVILGETATGGDKFIISGKGPVASLAATMRTNRFEQRLAKQGLEFRKADGGVRLVFRGDNMNNGRVFKNPDALLKALEADNLTRSMVNDIVKEQVPTWRWLKRAKIKKWISIRYHIPRFGIDTNENDPDKEQIKDMQEARLAQGYDRVSDSVEAAIDCFAGQNCPDQIEGDAGYQKDAKSVDGNDRTEDAGKELTKEAADKAAEEPMSKVVTTALSEKIMHIIAGKSYSAIPVIGQIIGFVDTASIFHHIAHKAIDNDFFSKVPAYFRSMSYAQMYADWQGFSDQIKAGLMPSPLITVLATQLNGLEESRAHSYLQGDATRGVPIKYRINENQPSSYIRYFEDILEVFDSAGFMPLNIIFEPLGIDKIFPAHVILNLWFDYIGTALDAVVGAVFKGIGVIIPDDLADALMSVIASALEGWARGIVESVTESMLPLLGLVVDPLDTGADLHNDLHAGATTTYNSYCEEELGCRKLSTAQAIQQNMSIAREQADYDQSKSLAYRLWDTENPRSFVNQLAIRSIHSNNPLTSTAQLVANLVGSLPQRLFGIIMPQTEAAGGYVDLYGLDPYGATDADLSQPVAQQAISGDGCPAVPKGQYNNCKVDTAVAEAMICNFKPESEECGNEPVSTSVPADSGGSVGGTGWEWPIRKENWPNGEMPVIECGLMYSSGTVHTGIDVPVPTGTPLYAATTFTPSYAGGSYGAIIGKTKQTVSGDPVYVNYQHMSRIDVEIGKEVQKGERVGLSGAVGTGGPHLHFGIWKTGSFLSGHDSVGSSAGQATLSQMYHPLKFLPDDGRNTNECKAPYALPG